MATIEVRQARQTVFVDTFTNGLLGPDVPMLGPVADGGHIVVNTTPGCWGPMITPSIRGGHEVCMPVAVEGAKVGDAIAMRIRDIEVTSLATASGNDQTMEGRFNGDPYVAPVCAQCHTLEAVGAQGQIGPNLDAHFAELRRQGFDESSMRDLVHAQIAHPMEDQCRHMNRRQDWSEVDLAVHPTERHRCSRARSQALQSSPPVPEPLV